MMKKRVYPFPLVFAVAFAFLIIFSPQLGKSESPRTIKLPSGEMVCDLNGQWNALHECYGQCMRFGRMKYILEIKQEGNRFVAIKLGGEGAASKGDELIRGELDQKGFKTGEVFHGAFKVWQGCKGEITDDGKKLIIDDGFCIKVTLEKR